MDKWIKFYWKLISLTVKIQFDRCQNLASKSQIFETVTVTSTSSHVPFLTAVRIWRTVRFTVPVTPLISFFIFSNITKSIKKKLNKTTKNPQFLLTLSHNNSLLLVFITCIPNWIKNKQLLMAGLVIKLCMNQNVIILMIGRTLLEGAGRLIGLIFCPKYVHYTAHTKLDARL